MTVAAISAAPVKITEQPNRARRSTYNTSNSDLIPGEYRASFRKRTTPKTNRTFSSPGSTSISQNGKTARRSTAPIGLVTYLI